MIGRRGLLTGVAALTAYAGLAEGQILNPLYDRPGWVLPGAIIDLDFANSRYFGAPPLPRQTVSSKSSIVEGNASQPFYAKNGDGLWISIPAFTFAISPGLGLNCFEQSWFQALWNRDLTNAAWTKTSCTAARSTGCDGASNSGSRLTATGANATCAQSITLASQATLLSVIVKRVTGSGTITLSVDNNSTTTAITPTATFTQIPIPKQTLANPTVVINMATSGDVIDIDFIDLETGSLGTIPCPLVPGPPILVTSTGNLERFCSTTGMNDGNNTGTLANGALGGRFMAPINMGNATIFSAFQTNARTSNPAGPYQTDGVMPVTGGQVGSPLTVLGTTTSNNCVAGTNYAMFGFSGNTTAGKPISGLVCLNGGAVSAIGGSSSGAVGTHGVIAGNSPGTSSIDGYTARFALWDHLPPASLFVSATTPPS